MSDLAVLTSAESFTQWRDSVVELPVVFVPTMGALHSGHAALIDSAHAYLKTHHNGNGRVVVSIFVNPTQFTEQSDLTNYPKTMESDLKLCAAHQVDVVFAPSPADIYPEGIEKVSLLDPGPKSNELEGKDRPGHFAGVVTVVSRLFDLVKPHAAFFGEKDYQQLVIIQELAQGLLNEIEIVAVPTVRDVDGLALSSRNQRLSIVGRAMAKQIPAALSLAEHALVEGSSVDETKQSVQQYLSMQAGIELEYFEIRTENLEEISKPGPARLLIAAIVNNVRLIDSVFVEIRNENVTNH
jgi:pantoate--beta-alanine ligase